MPLTIDPNIDCRNCVHGRCISYIREQSKKMKDRDTQYRLAQKASMACTYDANIPGFDMHNLGGSPLSALVNNCIDNGLLAGKFIENFAPEHFGKNIEQPFSLTSGQIGKVRGDIFEMLVRAILWNSSLCISKQYEDDLDDKTKKIFEKCNNNERYAAITLGDNYDLKKLFKPESKNEFLKFENAMISKGTSFCYSTPDLIVFKCNDAELWDIFSRPIKSLSIENQYKLGSMRTKIEGKLDPSDIVLAAGIKTSIRSDRMYQLLFEANAWKAIWRSIYGIEPSKYYGIIGQSYGADPEKLNSVEFTSITKDFSSIEKAIDGLVHISTPFDLMEWYATAFS